MKKIACISVDLDGLGHYEALHGLPQRSLPDAVMKVAPGRLAELLDERGKKGTFFAIGKEIPEGGEPLRTLAAKGHEIGNHTLDHAYDLTRSAPIEIHRQVEEGAKAVERATGKRPVTFRAPGYALTAELLRAVAATGHRADSSVFPAAPYYLAKGAVMAFRQLQGRRSVAILDRPSVLLAPRKPYRPRLDEPYKKGAGPLVELPLTVDPLLRLPFYGTLAVTAPWSFVRGMYSALRRLDFLNFHLHGVDLMDPSDGMDAEVALTTPDLAVPAKEKIRRLRELFSWLSQDREILTLSEAVNALGNLV